MLTLAIVRARNVQPRLDLASIVEGHRAAEFDVGRHGELGGSVERSTLSMSKGVGECRRHALYLRLPPSVLLGGKEQPKARLQSGNFMVVKVKVKVKVVYPGDGGAVLEGGKEGLRMEIDV